MRPHGPNRRTPTAAPAATDQITGTVLTVTFRADDTGYTVCTIKPETTKEPCTVVGNCPAIWVGEFLSATGSWTHHRVHGRQFQAATMTCIPPTSKAGIQKYLASGLIRGVGKVTAERLIKAFGKDVLRILEKDSGRLDEVEGIGAKRRQMIKDSWVEQKGIRDIMIFLQSHGVGTAQSARIYRRYGASAIQTISENPYRLCEDIWGIGFLTADGVAQSIGIGPDSRVRAEAGLVYVLNTMTDEGHCFCLESELLLRAAELLDIPMETLTPALAHQLEQGALVKELDRIYTRRLFRCETAVATKLGRLLATPVTFRPIDVVKAVEWAATRMKLNFADAQISALKLALGNKVSIITGGPGVGKTTIIRALVDVFQARKLNVRLAAPTGRAAKRMMEATGAEAMTLHRLLRPTPPGNDFEFHAGNPMPGDIFIIDEASMIDIELMHSFIQAVPDTACVFFVGDIDQLPSVGPGNVLSDMIQSGVIPCQKLDHIFRQEQAGYIVRNAHHVNMGDFLEIPPPGEKSDFYFVEASEPDDIIQKSLQLLCERIPRRFGFNPMTDVQVLTPMRRNQLGAENLNMVIQNTLNGSGPAIERHGRRYRVGDRVMQIRNNYDKEVFNGDIGAISAIDAEAHEIEVTIDDKPITYAAGELDELVHAYACSIHKSQGSEYPAVLIVISTQHFKLLQRNLLYTAITRGRKLVCIVGSSKAIRMAIHNNEIKLRRTRLRERLAERAKKL